MDTGEYLNVPVSIKEIEFLIDNFSPQKILGADFFNAEFCQQKNIISVLYKLRKYNTSLIQILIEI